jgi:5S rRNA maturation endonuclease (ribonuclease M5)
MERRLVRQFILSELEKSKKAGAIISEGALKGNLINHYFDQGVIIVQGVGNFPDDFGQALRKKLPELKKVSIAFDMDYKDNKAVQLQMKRLERSLTEAKIEVEMLKWDERMGKGLDDYARERLSAHFHFAGNELRAQTQEEVLGEIGFTAPGVAVKSSGREKSISIPDRRIIKIRIIKLNKNLSTI